MDAESADASLSGDLVVAAQPEGLLIEGAPEDVDSYVARLRESAGHPLEEVRLDSARGGKAFGLGAGAVSSVRQSGTFVQLSPESMKALAAGRRIPGDNGFYRMMTRGPDGKFLKQLQWKSTSVSPQRLMGAQMIAVQIALTSAIAQVDESVQRVEGKVDAVLKLAEAQRAGDIIGHHQSVGRLVRYLETHGSLPDAMWESVAALGPNLEAAVEQLRNHVTRTLADLPQSGSVSERAKLLHRAVHENRLGETLNLLVVAEESLYKWQRLLVARVAAKEPDHHAQVIDDSRQLLARQLSEDGKLYRTAKAAIDNAAQRTESDGLRYRAVRRLTDDRDTLRQALDDFARARRRQAEVWDDLAVPTPLKAVSATVDKALETTGRALTGAGQQLIDFGDVLANRRRRKQAAERHEQSDVTHTDPKGTNGGDVDGAQ
ncbi:hypothetical protein [Mycolicibacterium thermoresistibile]